ncbi:MAG TPA: RsmB/NOP family class I SAM-dependent RNA methyltransferase [Burkholderiaceae bacterium]|nr:RsmB/NOP family class I SAM-dependent RNA methyltransferase [Burkholderiaceae bacterium]
MHPKTLLDACTDLVRLVVKFDHPADAVVSRFFREHRNLGPRERNTLAETAYNVLRQKLLFEYLARSGPGSRERKLAVLGFHGDRNYIKSALTDAEAAWLDSTSTIPAGDLQPHHRHNLPDWLVQPLKAQVGDEFQALATSLNSPAPLDLRVNDFKQKRLPALDQLKKDAIDGVATPFSPWGIRIQGKPAINKLPAFVNGELEVQDEGSQLLAWLLEAKRGEMVADFCAGAGGKTLAIGAMMRNTGRLYAFDVSAHRLDALKPRLARSGLSNVHPVAIAHERDERIKRLAGKMDRVLVDAPCSGLGTLRRNPDLKWRQTAAGVQELQAKQMAILASAQRLVKSGGRLVYATCSILPDENEAVAEAFTAAHPDFVPVPVADVLGKLMASADTQPAPDAAALCAGPYLRLWPHRHDTDGFFAAVWERKA